MAMEDLPPPSTSVEEQSKATPMDEPVSSEPATQPPVARTTPEDGASTLASRQKIEPLAALGLEHFQTFSAAASNGPPQGDMTDVHMQGFDAAAYAEFQALFDVPAGLAAPYALPPSRMVRGHSEGGSADGKEEGASQTKPSDAEEVRHFSHVDTHVAHTPAGGSAPAATAVGESSAEGYGKDHSPGTAAESAEVGVEQALFDAAVRKEIARQVQEFLQSDAGRATLMREIMNTGTGKHPDLK